MTCSRARAINKLLVDGKIDLFKSKDGLLYRPKAPSKAATISGDQEEKIVFTIIEKAGNLGSWIRDIRGQSNLGQTQLTKVLKALESRKLIKVVKTVNATKKKVYMLYNLEPDHSVTGGAWYSEQDFESEFVEILNQQCYRFLHHRLTVSQATATTAGIMRMWLSGVYTVNGTPLCQVRSPLRTPLCAAQRMWPLT